MTSLKRFLENNLTNVGTGSGVFKQKSGLDVQLKSILQGYGVSVSPGTNELTVSANTAVTTLTDAATIAIDAAVGPQYMVTLGGNRTLGNPTNAAVGQDIIVTVAQDGTGGRTLAFSSDWIAADNTTTVNPAVSSVTVIYATARDYGAGVKWYYTLQHAAETGAGEANTASNVGGGSGWYKTKSGVDLVFKSALAGYGITVTPNTDDNTLSLTTAVTTLTDAATIAVDADLGPQYMVTLGGNRTLGNPTNAAVGKMLEIAVAQDGTGGRTLAFDTDFISVDNTVVVNPAINAVSYVRAVARNFGGGVKWYYTVSHSGEAPGETNTASNVGSGAGVFKTKTGVDLVFKSLLNGYGVTISGGTDEVTIGGKTTVTTLADGATIAIDAAVGPKYEVTIAGNRTLSNPTNAVEGQTLVIGVKQDATGGRTLAFDTDFIASGQLFQVAQSANAVSLVVAEARDFGGTLKWYYTIHHKESVYQISPSQLTAIAATGTLTATGNFANTETVTTGTKTYTFQTALTNVDGNVLIGASASDSLDNLIAAINLGAGSGTVYAASTTANGFVSAAAGAGDTMDATAITLGSSGNSIASTDTATNASWGGATLSGGTEDTIDYAPTGWSEANTIRVSSNATYDLHGFDAVALQLRKKFINVGSFNIVINNQSGTETTAANRIICQGGTSMTLLPDDVLDFEYDSTTARWRVV
jgi:hypothetical protein